MQIAVLLHLPLTKKSLTSQNGKVQAEVYHSRRPFMLWESQNTMIPEAKSAPTIQMSVESQGLVEMFMSD